MGLTALESLDYLLSIAHLISLATLCQETQTSHLRLDWRRRKKPVIEWLSPLHVLNIAYITKYSIGIYTHLTEVEYLYLVYTILYSTIYYYTVLFILIPIIIPDCELLLLIAQQITTH